MQNQQQQQQQQHGQLLEETVVQCPYTSSNCPLFNPIFTEQDVVGSLPRQTLPSTSEPSLGYSHYSIAPGPSAPSVSSGALPPQHYGSGSFNSLVSLANAVNSPGGLDNSLLSPLLNPSLLNVGGGGIMSPSIRPTSSSSCGGGGGGCGPPKEQARYDPVPIHAGPSEARGRSVERDMEDYFAGRKSGEASPVETGSVGSPASAEDSHHEAVTPFISKLSHLLSHAEYANEITFNATGDAFIFMHTSAALLEVFARFFRHSNVHSFVRQLNIYGFTRLPTLALLSAIDSSPHASSLSPSDFSGFSHPLFWRSTPNHPCDLSRIKPKGAAAKGERKVKRKRNAGEDEEWDEEEVVKKGRRKARS